MNDDLLERTVNSGWKSVIDKIINIITILLIILLAGAIIVYMFFRPYYIKGESMLPTIESGKTIVASTVSGNAERGDVVIIDTSVNNTLILDESNYIIKRVVAVGGDKIGFVYNENKTAYYLYINSGDGFKKISEPYLKEEMTRTDEIFNGIEICEDITQIEHKFIEIKIGNVFVMGDNRNESADSRKFGQFSLNAVKGKLLFQLEKNGLGEFIFKMLFRNNLS